METIKIIGSIHKFSNYDNKCPALNSFAKNILIDNEHVSIVASVHYYESRFVIDTHGKLYLLMYGIFITRKSIFII